MSVRRTRQRHLLFALLFLLIAGLVFAYLLHTGERGLGRQIQANRTIEVKRLGEAETRLLGWNAKALDAVFDYAANLSTDSLMIVTDGQTVGELGDPTKPYDVHSIRKVFLSALVGQHAGSGADRIPLNATLRELGIDDSPVALSDLQRTATVGHLLKSTSGINHPAAGEAGLTAEKVRRLGNGDNEPGTKWAYNNWDYNALTTIFEKRTGLSVARAFLTGIAKPAGMMDFDEEAVSYVSDPTRSVHKSAAFKMSARDLAAFGKIYLNKGHLVGKQILHSSWIDRIPSGYTKTDRTDLRWGHSDLWWLPSPQSGLPAGTFWAWGLGNQALFVIPAWNTVIVVQSDTTEFLQRFLPMITDGKKPAEKGLEELILSCLEPEFRESEYCVEHRFTTRREFEKLILLIQQARI